MPSIQEKGAQLIESHSFSYLSLWIVIYFTSPPRSQHPECCRQYSDRPADLHPAEGQTAEDQPADTSAERQPA